MADAAYKDDMMEAPEAEEPEEQEQKIVQFPRTKTVKASTLYKRVNSDSGSVTETIASSVQLDDQQKAKIVNDTLARLGEIETEMGMDDQGEPITVMRDNRIQESWMSKRNRYYLENDDDFEHRLSIGGKEETVYDYSNWSMNLAKRYCRLLSAKSQDDLLGTDPFFAAMPKRGVDPTLSKAIEEWVQGEISRSNFKTATNEAIDIANVLGECVLKRNWKLKGCPYKGKQVVAVGAINYLHALSGEEPFQIVANQVVVTPKGNYLFPNDDVIEDPNVEGLLRLKKEPNFSMPPEGSITYQLVPNLNLFGEDYEGIEKTLVFFRDWRCPLNASTIHEADMCGNVLDISYDDLSLIFKDLSPKESHYAEYRASLNASDLSAGENIQPARLSPMVHLFDCYRRFSPAEGMPVSEYWMLIDLKNKKLIWIDYLYNHQSSRPFEVHYGLTKKKYRWYGIGVREFIEHKSEFIDTQMNRVNHKSGKTSTLRFRNVTAVEQWSRGEPLVFNGEDVLDIKDATFNSQNPPFFTINTVEIEPFAMELLQLMIVAAQTEIGIISPDDGTQTGMPTTQLATGIRALERTGNQLQKAIESVQAGQILESLRASIETSLEHMDDETLYFSDKSQTLVTLNKSEIRKLVRKGLRLLLSRTRSTETIENAGAAISLIKDYFVQNPEIKFYARENYVRQLKALEEPDADETFPEVTPEELQAYYEALQNPQEEDKPPSKSLSTKYDELARSEQEQVLAQYGITPASPEEIEVEMMERAKREALSKPQPTNGSTANRPGTNKKPAKRAGTK